MAKGVVYSTSCWINGKIENNCNNIFPRGTSVNYCKLLSYIRSVIVYVAIICEIGKCRVSPNIMVYVPPGPIPLFW